jgi:hypothetical protein
VLPVLVRARIVCHYSSRTGRFQRRQAARQALVGSFLNCLVRGKVTPAVAEEIGAPPPSPASCMEPGQNPSQVLLNLSYLLSWVRPLSQILCGAVHERQLTGKHASRSLLYLYTPCTRAPPTL